MGTIVVRYASALALLAWLLVGPVTYAAASDRVTGDTAEDPFWIDVLPAEVLGNTCGFDADYDEMCPYGANAPDVIYAYTATEGALVDITLCGSSYDTKLIVYENSVTWGMPHACNDDACSGPNYPLPYLSRAEDVPFLEGNTYFIVVTGYGNECGDYKLQVEATAPCDMSCPPGGITEGEPDCHDDYYDEYNGGCFNWPFSVQTLLPSADEILVCGRTGAFMSGSYPHRDSDWYEITPADSCTIELCVSAEFLAEIAVLDGTAGCPGALLAEATSSPCLSACINETLPPGTYWLRVQPLAQYGVYCGVRYLMTLDGYDVAATGVASGGATAASVLGIQGYPNPSGPRIRIRYELPAPASVTVAVYDVAGRRLRVLVDEVARTGGLHRVEWDGRDGDGRLVGAGVYLLELRGGDRRATGKLVLVR